MALYVNTNKTKVKNLFACFNGTTKNIASVWVEKDGSPIKVFGRSDNNTINVTENCYIAKSRGSCFELVIPDEESTTCTMPENNQLSLSENKVTISKNADIGTVLPITVKGVTAAFTVNIIVSPDISSNSFEIKNSNDLVTLGKICQYNATNDADQNAHLLNDIDLSDVCSASLGSWNAIPTYSGVFDGRNHAIHNLYVSVAVSKYNTLYAGFINTLDGATIKNATLYGTIKVSYSSGTAKPVYIGGFCGYTKNNSNKTNTLYNLTNNCTFSINNPGGYVGGICGYALGTTFNKCLNNSAISGNASSIGGICGTRGTFINCHNNNALYNSNGIAGGICGDNCSVSFCSNSGDITATSNNYAGGIVAKGSAEYCYNTGNISSTHTAGGIVALADHPINDCYNTGIIGSSKDRGSSGGICGNSVYVNITNCFNTGTIIGLKSGGISGSGSGSMINCYNIGAISSNGSSIGQILGYAPSRVYIRNCFILSGYFCGNKEDNAKFDNSEKVSSAALKTYADKLGDAFMEDSHNTNGGYPILKFKVQENT